MRIPGDPLVSARRELNTYYAEISGLGDGRSLAATLGAIISLQKGIRIDLGIQEVLRGRNTDDGRIYLANFSLTLG